MSNTQLDRYIDWIVIWDKVLIDWGLLEVLNMDKYWATLNLDWSDIYMSWGVISEEYEYSVLEAKNDYLTNESIDTQQHN